MADELGTTVAVLQGATPEAPPSANAQIEERVRALLNDPTSKIHLELEKYDSHEDAVKDPTELISRQLQAAQLSQDQSELSDLARMLDWPVSKLQHTAGLHGHWLLIGSGVLGPQRSEVFAGVHELIHEVSTDLEKSLQEMSESDFRIAFVDETPWYRIDIKHPRLLQLTRTLRFVRVQPTEEGLKWTKAAEWENELIYGLPRAISHLVNFIDGFSAERRPSHGVDKLCLALKVVPDRHHDSERTDLTKVSDYVALARQSLGDISPAYLRNTKQDGFSHDDATSRLARDMWTPLQLHMHEWPIKYWRFHAVQQRIDISVDAPTAYFFRQGRTPRLGPLFRICLVEELPSSQLVELPWRDLSVKHVCKQLQHLLDKALEEVKIGPPDPESLRRS